MKYHKFGMEKLEMLRALGHNVDDVLTRKAQRYFRKRRIRDAKREKMNAEISLGEWFVGVFEAMRQREVCTLCGKEARFLHRERLVCIDCLEKER